MLLRILKYSAKNILRNKFLSISSVLVLGLLIFFINILVVLHNVSINLISEVNSKLTISLYLKDDVTKNSVSTINFLADIKKLSGDISVEFKGKDDVLRELEEKDPELVKILEKDNPLPPTITISGISLDKYEQLNSIISTRSSLLIGNEEDNEIPDEMLDGLELSMGTGSISGTGEELANIESSTIIPEENVYSYQAQYERINNVIFILNALKIGLYFIIGIFMLSIAIIVYSVIGNFIYYYRSEIYITKLVGGSNIFIYGPFSLQGLIYILLAFFISIIIFVLLFNNISSLFGIDTSSFHQYIFNENFTKILFVELIVFSFLGFFSGFLSSKKYLKNN